MYKKPDMRGSFRENNLGETLYNYVLQKKPKVVFEVGSNVGHSAICIAQALIELMEIDGKERWLYCFDLWDPKKYNRSNLPEFKENIKRYKVNEVVIPIQLGLDAALKWETPKPDMMFVDISNDGDIIRRVAQCKPSQHVLFEGGTTERDDVGWMKNQNRTPIVGCCNYRVLNKKFPGISEVIYE